MAKCSYCDSFILFGGVRHGARRFCNGDCAYAGRALDVVGMIPDEVVVQTTEALHQGECPRCRGRGPVDVHVSYTVWSVLIITQWRSHTGISCRTCAVKRQVGHTLSSLLLGWWGLPWGVIFTPVQVFRNIHAICAPPSAAQPSAELKRIVALRLAEQLMDQRMRQRHPPQRQP